MPTQTTVLAPTCGLCRKVLPVKAPRVLVDGQRVCGLCFAFLARDRKEVAA